MPSIVCLYISVVLIGNRLMTLHNLDVGVMLSGVIIWKLHSPSRYYADPAVSLAISIMIFSSAVPLSTSPSSLFLCLIAPDQFGMTRSDKNCPNSPRSVSRGSRHTKSHERYFKRWSYVFVGGGFPNRFVHSSSLGHERYLNPRPSYLAAVPIVRISIDVHSKLARVNLLNS